MQVPKFEEPVTMLKLLSDKTIPKGAVVILPTRNSVTFGPWLAANEVEEIPANKGKKSD